LHTNPFWATPQLASLNRVVIQTAPDLPTGRRGQKAFDLLSKKALIALIRERGLLPTLPDADLPLGVNTLDSNALADLAAEMGQRLFWLLHTLKEGSAENRAARAEWNADHWAFWASQKSLYLGGGLVAGALGPLLVNQACRLGAPYQVTLAPDPAHLPLGGLAHLTSPQAAPHLLLDFGQTQVKAAYARNVEGLIQPLEHLPNFPVPPEALPNPYTPPDQIILEKMRDFMVAAIAQQWRPACDPLILISLASYVQNGQPIDNGVYGRLRQLAADVPGHLANRVGQRIGQAVKIRLVHDGTAAAQGYAGQPQTAVILLGTALGVGFAPPSIEHFELTSF
jgi:hypothetical protein